MRRIDAAIPPFEVQIQRARLRPSRTAQIAKLLNQISINPQFAIRNPQFKDQLE
jgi:hypothetical protein